MGDLWALGFGVQRIQGGSMSQYVAVRSTKWTTLSILSNELLHTEISNPELSEMISACEGTASAGAFEDLKVTHNSLVRFTRKTRTCQSHLESS